MKNLILIFTALFATILCIEAQTENSAENDLYKGVFNTGISANIINLTILYPELKLEYYPFRRISFSAGAGYAYVKNPNNKKIIGDTEKLFIETEARFFVAGFLEESFFIGVGNTLNQGYLINIHEEPWKMWGWRNYSYLDLGLKLEWGYHIGLDFGLKIIPFTYDKIDKNELRKVNPAYEDDLYFQVYANFYFGFNRNY